LALYAIGDVQGCLGALKALLARLDFRADRDRLWFCGDLVNRGPDSLGVLRMVRDLGDQATCVLGNHDLHLLAMAHGQRRYHASADTLAPVLAATDADRLLEWLLRRPLFHYDPERRLGLVHAGLLPGWDAARALSLAAEVQATLRSDQAADFFEHMYGNQPERWDDSLAGTERQRCIVNVFTRLRFCSLDGRMHLGYKGPPGGQPEPFRPWFQLRPAGPEVLVFGHWAALGLYRGPGALGLDSGCVWGNALSAARLDDGSFSITSVACNS
jgi:bis(5'-nucleosyl)-tetraphosphatase (symmetrical)